jgi:hypothetical protein
MVGRGDVKKAYVVDVSPVFSDTVVRMSTYSTVLDAPALSQRRCMLLHLSKEQECNEQAQAASQENSYTDTLSHKAPRDMSLPDDE